MLRLALAIALTFLTGWEIFWRERDFVPSVSDSPVRWSIQRRLLRADADNREAVAVLGSSRAMFDIDPDALAEQTGWQRPVQLGIPAAGMLPLLEDLADDPAFRGTAICGVDVTTLFNSRRLLDGVSRQYIEGARDLGFSARLESELSVGLQEHTVVRLAPLSPRELASSLAAQRWPRPQPWILRRDRFAGYASELDELERRVAETRNRLAAAHMRPYPPGELAALIRRVARLSDVIRDRGGRTIFVRLPTSDPYREIEKSRYPRTQYWDVFAAGIGSLAVHVDDEPELSGFETPDGSHLDRRDVPDFTRALAEVLVRRLEGDSSRELPSLARDA